MSKYIVSAIRTDLYLPRLSYRIRQSLFRSWQVLKQKPNFPLYIHVTVQR